MTIAAESSAMSKRSQLDRIAVIGGGRWARTIIGVLGRILTVDTQISIHSPRNAEGMSAWVSRQFPSGNFVVSPLWPEFHGGERSALIVANAARDHEKAARLGLLAGVPVLVEKPLTPTTAAAYRLFALARDSGSQLCVAHVFRFARNVGNFAQSVRMTGKLRRLDCWWIDPIAEQVRGEMKKYDPSLPVFVDCLPHVVSIIATLVPEFDLTVQGVKLTRGGAEIEIAMIAGDIAVHLVLARDADVRKRRVMAEVTTGAFVELDFSLEPGVIRSPGGETPADSDWSTAPSPLTELLSAFLVGATGVEWDTRLSTGFALSVARLADQVWPRYQAAQSAWIFDQRRGCNFQVFDEAGLIYANRELQYLEEPLPCYMKVTDNPFFG